MPASLNQERLAVSHRMQRALAQAGYQQVEAAREAGVPRAAIHKAVQRGSIPRDKATRDKVAQVLGVDASWLWAVGSAEQSEPQTQAKRMQSDTETISAPAASAVRQVSAPQLPMDPKGYALVIPHSDFQPIVMRNDCLWVTPSYAPETGDRVYVHTSSDEEVIAVLSDMDSNHYYLMTPGGGRRSLRKDSVGALHKVSGVIA